MATVPTQAGIGTLPPELYAQQQALNRQQQMAQLLMQQGQSMPSGQMVSGRFVAPSFFQYAAPLAQTFAATRLQEKGDKQATELAQALRKRYADEVTEFLAKPEGQERFLFGSTAYNPALQTVSMKKLTEGPKWERAEMPQPDGSVKTGWVNYNSPDPKSTFVEGGTKPAFTPLEGARFTYDTGMAPPTGGARQPAGGAAPTGGAVPTGGVVSNVVPAGGNVPVAQTSAMTPTAGMSPKDLSEANKIVFADVEKRRRENLENAPRTIATIEDTLRNVNDLIGDARVIKDPKTGKERIDYSVTVDGKQVQGRKPQAGFELAVGAGVPSWLPFQGGTDVSNFRIRLDQIKDRTFLEAFQQLKGSGQITEKEGEKATSALNRMNLAQSEVEFIKAAREFEENLNRGMALAKQKAGIQGGAPSTRLRWNPAKNAWE
jgi:hypothetical protein